jgi:hypothetical protein
LQISKKFWRGTEMLEKQEFTGFWWLPEEPELKISGKLVLDPFKEA